MTIVLFSATSAPPRLRVRIAGAATSPARAARTSPLMVRIGADATRPADRAWPHLAQRVTGGWYPNSRWSLLSSA
jgi:hypothetical protein